jgi:orotate phosphoribosyltransferase
MLVKNELESRGCIYNGHFIGTSGAHLSGYCNLDPLMPHAGLLSDLVKLMVEPFIDSGVETILVPAVGAIPLAHWGAYHLTKTNNYEVYGVWADKIKPKGFAIERSGFLEKVEGKRVLILEDFVNKMYSVKELVKLVNGAGGTPIGVAAIAANKGAKADAIGVPRFVKLTTVAYETWSEDECMKTGLCHKKIPIVEDIGHGDEFKLRFPKYVGGFTELLKN